jgi:hypothetical protein
MSLSWECYRCFSSEAEQRKGSSHEVMCKDMYKH